MLSNIIKNIVNIIFKMVVRAPYPSNVFRPTFFDHEKDTKQRATKASCNCHQRIALLCYSKIGNEICNTVPPGQQSHAQYLVAELEYDAKHLKDKKLVLTHTSQSAPYKLSGVVFTLLKFFAIDSPSTN